MRHHFHRCGHLRVISVPAHELHGGRRGGSVILEELCDARRLTPCLGLADCDILSPAQKRDLLVERATAIRREEGRPTELSGVPARCSERLRELRELRERLAAERTAIVEENRRIHAERIAAAAGLPPDGADGEDLAAAGLSVRFDEALEALGAERLDALDAALEAMRDAAYGACGICGGEIEIERLRRAPRTRMCAPCAHEASPPPGLRARA